MTEPVSQREFARQQGWSPAYVTRLKQAGRLVLAAGGGVLVAESLAKIRQTEDPNRDDVRTRHAKQRGKGHEYAENGGNTAPTRDSGPSPLPSPPDADSSASRGFAAARAVRERYGALSAKLEYEKQLGKMVDSEAVRMAAAEAGAALRARLENLPDQLAPVLAPITDEDETRRLLDDYIEQALTELADKFVASVNQIKHA